MNCPRCNHILSEEKNCNECGFDYNTVANELFRLKNEYRTITSKFEQDILSFQSKIEKLEAQLKRQPETQLQSIEINAFDKTKNVVLETKQQEVTKNESKQSESSRPATIASIPFLPKEPKIRQIPQYLLPLHEGFQLLANAYSKYKKEGKLALFFMTLTGIAAILFGFGFLLQHTLSSLNEIGLLIKLVIGLCAASGIYFLGKKLYQKKAEFKEFGSGLMSLSLLLNYTLIYFLGDLDGFVFLSSALFGFLLIVANTALGIYSSLKYETKIIAVLSVVGGAFTPFYLNSSGDGSSYFVYLFLLNLAAIYVANKICWFNLFQIAFAISVVVIEIAIINSSIAIYLQAAYVQLFFFTYLYFATAFKEKYNLQKPFYYLFAANFAFLLISSLSIFPAIEAAGFALLGDALIILLLALFEKSKFKPISFALITGSALLVAHAVAMLFDTQLMGLLWTAEAFLLILFGFKTEQTALRKEGYLLMVLGFGQYLFMTMTIFNNWGLGYWNEGIMNLLFLGISLIVLWRYSLIHKTVFIPLEVKIESWLKEIIPLWVVVLIYVIGYHLIGNFIFCSNVLLILGSFYWQNKFKSKSTTILGYGLFACFVISYFISFKMVQNYHFSNQLLFAQISILSGLGLMWYLKSFVLWLNPVAPNHSPAELSTNPDNESTTSNASFNSQIVLLNQQFRMAFFALIALAPPYFSAKFFPEITSTGCFVTLAVCYLLHRKLQYAFLPFQGMVLFGLGIYASIIGYHWFNPLAGILTTLFVLLFEKAHLPSYKESNWLTFFQFSPYGLAFLITSLGFEFYPQDSTFLFFPLALVIQGFLFRYSSLHAGLIYSLRRNASIILTFMLFVGFVFSASKIIGLTLIILTLNVLLLIKTSGISIEKPILENVNSEENEPEQFNKPIFSIVLLQLQIQLASVLFNLYYFKEGYGLYFTIFLGIHAIVLVLCNLKDYHKALNYSALILFGIALLKVIMIDTKTLDLVQKVILFIVLGIALLSGSYLQIKLKKRL